MNNELLEALNKRKKYQQRYIARSDRDITDYCM